MKHTASCWCSQDKPQTFGLTNESITNCIINHLSNQHFQSMLVFFLNSLLWILPVLVLHQKYLCSFQRRCFQSRWFEGGTEAGPRLCKGEEGRWGAPSPAQPLQPPQLPSHLVQPQWDEEKPLFCQAIPLLMPALMEGTKSFIYTETGFLKENLRFPQQIHPAHYSYLQDLQMSPLLPQYHTY